MCQKPKPYYEALPDSLKPLHYDLSIFEISENTFKGIVKINLQVQASTDEIFLHYRDLKIESVKAVYKNRNVSGEIIEENEKKEYFVARFGEVFSDIDTNITVEVEYSGTVQTNMAGFYKSSYTQEGESKRMLSTQFEATDARRTFPCFDEPALKATFTVHITTDAGLTVLGNMPVEETQLNGEEQTVTFQKTPVMSTYLLAWAIGEFDYIEGFTSDKYVDNKPLPVRVYTTKGYTEEAELAVEIAPKIVDLFSKVFGVKYPLPKLDLLAVHAFSHNAMENWGLITYRSTALLYSAAHSDPTYKQKVAYVVAHEIAHQWFGNLVTMQWWDELWLNEGFATWVGFYAVDCLFPEWDIFADFVSTSLQEALRLDGLRNSHPIKVAVRDALDIDQLFDAISYLKGASTILMLSTYLNTDVFLRGVGKYLNENKYGNATSEDLWRSVSEVSGQNISGLMSEWILKIGFPVVHVSQTDSGSLKLTQNRFLNGGDVRPDEDETTWWVPISVLADNDTLKTDFFSERSTELDVSIQGLFKLNRDTGAPLRINYCPKFLKTHVLEHFSRLSHKDKVGVIADVAAIAVSGDKYTSTTTFLDLVKQVAVDNDWVGTNYATWHELANRLSTFALVFGKTTDESAGRISALQKTVYSKLATQFASESVKTDDYSSLKLRALIMNKAATLHIPALHDLALALYAKWKSDGTIDSSMRTFVLQSIVSCEIVSDEDFDFIMTQVTHPKALDSREVALTALGSTCDVSVATRMLNYMIDESVIPIMDAHFLAVPLAKNPTTRDLLWSFFKNNYTQIYAKMSTNMVVLDRFIKLTLCHFQSLEMEREVRDFFANKDVHGFERALNQVLDQIHINASWFARDSKNVDDWLMRNL